MATYQLTITQLPQVLAALPAPLRAPASGLAFAYAEGSSINGDLTTTDAIDAQVAPVIAVVLAGGTPVAPIADLRASLIDAASTACASIITQVTPDATQQAAYQNAAAIVNANGNAAPTSAPLQAKFAALATQTGAASPAALAAIVVAAQGASLDLSTALIALKKAAIAATTAAALATALTAFNTALAAVVTEVNAAVLSPITAPDTISIVGINA